MFGCHVVSKHIQIHPKVIIFHMTRHVRPMSDDYIGTSHLLDLSEAVFDINVQTL